MVKYLEINNMLDIVVVPTQKLGYKHLKEHSIVCTGHTQRHIYKIAKELVVEIKKLNLPNLLRYPQIYGRRDEEWLLVEVGEVSVHFMVESFRKEQDLVGRWLNPMTHEQQAFMRKFSEDYYRKKNSRL